ncbi:unnamed protein product [Closterium sp. NIES-53]
MACEGSRRSEESPDVAAVAAGEGAPNQGGEQRRQKLWEMYDRMRDKLFTDVPEMSVTELHQLLLAQQAGGGGEGLGTNGKADGGGAGGEEGRGEMWGGGVSGEGGGVEVGGGSGRGRRRVVVVDTRTEEEVAVSMIPGGTLKQSDFERQMGRFSDHQVVCYCTIGYRSGNYARMLRSHHSMQAANLRGSILAWTHHRLPLTSLYHPQTGSGPPPLPHHANTSASTSSNTSSNTSTSHEATAQHQATADHEASGKGATGSGAATDLPVLRFGATTRVHVYSPKYELHADGYQPVHFASGVPWVSAVWSDISLRLPKWGPALVKASAFAGRVLRIPRHLGATVCAGRRPVHAAMALNKETASNEDGRSGEAEKARGEEEAGKEKVDKSSNRERRGEAGGKEKGEQESVVMTRHQWELVVQVDGGGRLVPVHVRQVGSVGPSIVVAPHVLSPIPTPLPPCPTCPRPADSCCELFPPVGHEISRTMPQGCLHFTHNTCGTQCMED